jgi:PAS domain S-box-containing protein
MIIRENDIQAILEKTAEIIGLTLQLDRSLIYSIDFKKHITDALCEWLNPEVSGVTPTKATYNLDIFLHGARFCFNERKYIESHIDDKNQYLIEDGSADILHSNMNIKSLLWYPFLFLENGFYGLVFNQITHRRIWNEAELKFVESASNQVSIALQKLDFIQNLKQAEARLEHLNKIVVTVRSVTQILARGGEQEELLRKICNTIVGFDIYRQAVIAVFDINKKPLHIYGSGFENKINEAVNRLVGPPHPQCLTLSLENPDTVNIHESGFDCSNCPFSLFFEDDSYVISKGFRFGDDKLGYIAIQTKPGEQLESEEKAMFNEICDDVAYALGKFEMDRKHREAENIRKEKDELYRLIIDNTSDSIAIVVGENYVFANQAMQAMLGYSLDEIRQMSFDTPLADTPEGREKILNIYKRRIRGDDVPSRYTAQLASRDGNVIDVFITASAITIGGKMGSVIIVRKAAEIN